MDSEYLKLKRSNCKNCHKCIRNCPVKSIRFSDGHAQIIGEACLLCGQCFVVCPQNAKIIRDDLPLVKEAIASKKPVVVSLAPSFVANYRGATINSMRRALKTLGFAEVEETAVGASIVKTRYEELLDAHSVLISSCCPVVNDLIREYYPDALPYLANVVTPMEAHARLIKRARPDAVTVYIGPCIAKKREADHSSYIDISLTFEDLTRWLVEEGVMLTPEPDELDASRTRLFPTAGGIWRTMKRDPAVTYVSVDGMQNCIAAIKDIISGELEHCFIEMSACAGSCIGGPAMERRALPVRDYAIVNAYAGRKDYVVAQPPAEELTEQYEPISTNAAHIGETAIELTLRQMGKLKPEDELNCGFCGYDTCREKAEAVCQGKAEISMCLPYLMEKAKSFSDIIIQNSPNGVLVLNESFEIQDLNHAACTILNIKNRTDVVGRPVVSLLNPIAAVQAAREGRTVRRPPEYLSEYGRYIEQTVMYDKTYRIVILLLRDVTEQEAVRTEKESVSVSTVQAADRVIEHQIRMAQEIASLLGETVAETKAVLTTLKESVRNE